MKAQLHHFAYTIQPNTLETVLELFEKFDCTVAYRKDGARWCQIEQKPTPIDIQIIETDVQPTPLGIKTSTHISFLSHTPTEDIDVVEKWSGEKNTRFIRGQWSEKEQWFDLPDLFTNFVIEIMHTSVIDDAINNKS